MIYCNPDTHRYTLFFIFKYTGYVKALTEGLRGKSHTLLQFREPVTIPRAVILLLLLLLLLLLFCFSGLIDISSKSDRKNSRSMREKAITEFSRHEYSTAPINYINLTEPTGGVQLPSTSSMTTTWLLLSMQLVLRNA